MFPKLTRLTLNQEQTRETRNRFLELGNAWMARTIVNEKRSFHESANNGRPS